jgi:hypothetical protein
MRSRPFALAALVAGLVLSLPPPGGALVLQGTYNTAGSAFDVDVVGTLVYVADGSAGLRIVDISNPGAPFEVGFLDTAGFAYGVDVVGDLAYVADGTLLRIVNVSDPSSPSQVGSFDSPGTGTPVKVEVVGELAYVADGDTSLRILDVSDPAAPEEVGSFDAAGFVNDVEVEGTLAFVTASAEEFLGLHAVDVSNPATPVGFRVYESPSVPVGLDVSGTVVHVGDGPAVDLIDVASSPVTLLGTFALPDPTDDFVFDVDAVGDLVYVAGSTFGFSGSSGWLRALDFSDPSAPVELEFHSTVRTLRRVEVSGGLVVVAASEDGVRVYASGPACSDGLDDDGDGLVDFPDDPGCRDADQNTENPNCQDGIDNDGDGGTDFDGGESALGPGNGDPDGPDPQCVGKPWRKGESAGGCGLGFEVALVLGLLAWRRRRA